MYTLSAEDTAELRQEFSKFKILVPLSSLQTECDSGILKELLDDVIDFALRYTESVCRWQRVAKQHDESFDTQGTRQAVEDTRRAVHNVFNDHVNILSRTMVRHKKSVKWRDLIGHDRAALGLFALTISFEYVRQQTEGGVR